MLNFSFVFFQNVICSHITLPLFIAMGVRELSMNYYSIPQIKKVIHDLSFKDCNDIFNKCLGLTSPEEIKKELFSLVENKMPIYGSFN